MLPPSDTGDFFQDKNSENNVINVNEATTPPFYPPAGDLSTSNSEIYDGPGKDKNPDNLNIDSLTATLDPLTDTNILEAGCVPDKTATPGKLRKRQDLVCPPNYRLETDPDADTADDATTDYATKEIVTQEDLDNLMKLDTQWMKEHGRAAALGRQHSPCTRDGGFHRYAACCLPPPLTFRGVLGGQEQKWTSFRTCQLFFERRPWCVNVKHRMCCNELMTTGAPVRIVPGTHFGSKCIPMAA